MSKNRDTVLVGDIHGCYDELQELLAAINFHPEKIRLIFCGDYGNRGPKSAECIWFIRALCEKGAAEALMGNHENQHIRRRGHEISKALSGKENPMKPMSPNDSEYHSKLSDSDIAWMRKLPLKIHIRDNWWAIHGGLEPFYDFNHQSPEQIIRCRYVSNGTYVTSNGKLIERGRAVPMENMMQPTHSLYWTDLWNGPQSIVYGHCVHSLHTPLIDKRPNGVKCVGIDTGCVFGGHLTAFFLEKNEFVKVKAKRTYCTLKATFDE